MTGKLGMGRKQRAARAAVAAPPPRNFGPAEHYIVDASDALSRARAQLAKVSAPGYRIVARTADGVERDATPEIRGEAMERVSMLEENLRLIGAFADLGVSIGRPQR